MEFRWKKFCDNKSYDINIYKIFGQLLRKQMEYRTIRDYE